MSQFVLLVSTNIWLLTADKQRAVAVEKTCTNMQPRYCDESNRVVKALNKSCKKKKNIDLQVNSEK